MTNFELYLSTPEGIKDSAITEYFKLDYALGINEITTATVVLPFSQVIWNKLRRDLRLEIYRNGLLEGSTCWFLRRYERATDSQGKETITLLFERAIALLARRIVEGAAGSSYTKQKGLPSWLMYTVVNQNFYYDTNFPGMSATQARGVALEYEVSWTGVTEVSKAYAKAVVLDVLKELSSASVQLGEGVYFDVVAGPNYPRQLCFQTYFGQRGANRCFPDAGDNAVLIGGDTGNLEDALLVYDYTNEATVIYVGGQGEGNQRRMVAFGDNARIAASSFGRIEKFIDARGSDTIDQLILQANEELNNAAPKVTFTGKIIDKANSRYGIDWFWGDLVSVSHYGLSFPALVKAVSVSYDDNGESITTAIEASK